MAKNSKPLEVRHSENIASVNDPRMADKLCIRSYGRPNVLRFDAHYHIQWVCKSGTPLSLPWHNLGSHLFFVKATLNSSTLSESQSFKHPSDFVLQWRAKLFKNPHKITNFIISPSKLNEYI